MSNGSPLLAVDKNKRRSFRFFITNTLTDTREQQ